MKSAKIIAFISFISHSLLTVLYLDIFLKLRQTLQGLDIQMQSPWTILIPLIFAVGSLSYWFYLRGKEKKGEKVKFALLISFILLLASFVYTPIIVIPLIESLYNLLGST